MSRGGRTDNGNARKRRNERSRSRSPQKGDPKRIAGGRDGDRRSGANDRMVFITNLAYEVRWVELKDILREHGGEVVFVELLEDRNGHPKGNAIAEFKTKEGATNCIKNLDGFEIRKRKIITKLIRDPVAFLRKVQEETGIDYLAKCGGSWLSRGRSDDRPARTGSFDLFGLSPEFLRQHNIDPPLCDRVFIANLSFNVGTGRIYEIFGLAGNIVWMDLHMDKEGKSKGVCILQFSHPIEAVQAISMFHGQKLYDRVLVVKMDRYEKNEPAREGALPRGLEGIGAGLGANGAPLTDIASVVAGIRGDASVAVAPVAPVAAQPAQFPSFGMNSGGVISGGTAFQSTPYSLTSHISNGQSFGGLGSSVGAFSSALGGFESRREDSYTGADSRRDDAQFGMNFNVSRVVVIRNLPPDYTWQIVRDRVQQFGDAESVEMIAAGVARIRFALIQDAERMRGALTGTSVEGRTISVEYVH